MNDFQCITEFERYLLTEKRVAKNTFEAYKSDVTQFVTYLLEAKSSLQECSDPILKDYLKSLKNSGISARSMARKISSLKKLFFFLHLYHGYTNSAEKLMPPKLEKKLPLYAQEEEIKKLLEASHIETTDAGIRNKVMLYLLYTSGMRISELVHATVSGLEFSERTIRISGKGGRERIIPLPESIMKLLSDYLTTTHPRLTIQKGISQSTDFLFPTHYNGALRAVTRQSFWMYLKELVKKAGLSSDFSPHHLRHSVATHLLTRGMNIRSLQMFLGHENISTVQIYTHVETSHLRTIYDKKHPRS